MSKERMKSKPQRRRDWQIWRERKKKVVRRKVVRRRQRSKSRWTKSLSRLLRYKTKLFRNLSKKSK